VAIDEYHYINKMEDLLRDQDTYINIKKNPINELNNSARTLLTRWTKNNYITTEVYKKLYCSDGILPRAYGLPKIHKPNNPLRIIISSNDSLLYFFAKYLHDIISNSIPKPFSHIDNSFQLIKKLNGFSLSDECVLVSLDAVSLFTNIPIDLAIESVSRRWIHISSCCQIPKNEFITALHLILDSTYFTFNDKLYKQKFGTPMGSPLSPVIADLVLLDLEIVALERFGFEVPFYFRYVDDIATAVHRTQIDRLLNIFNSFHPRIQFTIEIRGNFLNFLDITLIKNNKKIEFDWFHKPTFSGRYLNFLSLHPITQKRGSLMSMIDRALLLSHPIYHNKNINFIINTFLQNDYPLQFIFNTINLKLKTIINKRNNNNIGNETNNNTSKINWFTIPYFLNISERFKNIIKNLNVKLSFYSLNKLDRIIKAQKDRLPDYSKKNVVYKISCKDCDATYVG